MNDVFGWGVSVDGFRFAAFVSKSDTRDVVLARLSDESIDLGVMDDGYEPDEGEAWGSPTLRVVRGVAGAGSGDLLGFVGAGGLGGVTGDAVDPVGFLSRLERLGYTAVADGYVSLRIVESLESGRFDLAGMAGGEADRVLDVLVSE